MIICANCTTENPDGHKFCSNCGHGLAAVCPNCATENEPGNKFCFNCGTGLALDGATPIPSNQAQAGGPGVPERRFVSVLFADLVGFTTFSEGRDAEDVRAMLTDYYDRCRVIIARYGGTTDKFIGDAVMGVWGAVAAHEDDAERATRAALEIVDMVAGLGSALGIGDLAARAGVLSGEASVGPGGNEQGLVVGDLVNTASRLQSIAPSGGVVVGQSTRDLVGNAVEFMSLGDQQVKGKEEMVSAWQAVRVVASTNVRHGGELGEGPFVGREDELRILKDQLHATTRESQARMVSVVGEGGIGKTRLSEELIRYIEGITEVVYYHRGRSPSYGDGVTFWALGEMVRQRAGILESEDDAKSRLKLRTTVAEFAPDEDDQRWIEPRLAGLIGLAPMPPGDRSELFAALRTFFLRVAERGTTVMLFEDLHWADDGLLDFVQELVERTTRHPIIVLTLARSDLLERRPDWGSGQKRSLSMHLGRLDDDSVRDLIMGLAPGIDPEIASHVAERTAGVPLHAVEFIRMLVNSGRLVSEGDGYRFDGDVNALSIPDSVSAVIGARLDRLDQGELGVIQDASVLGYSFSLGDLARMRSEVLGELEAKLRDLTRREILELDEDPRSPERGQYRFVQSLIREVTYGRLARTDRVSRHLLVARQFEETGDVEVAGIVASHYADAAAADPENVELAEKARQSIVAAGRRALSLHSHSQAVALFDRAIELTPDPVDGAELLLDLSHIYQMMGRSDDAVAAAQTASAAFESAGNQQGVVRAVTEISRTLSEFRADEATELILPVYESTPRTHDAVWVQLASQTSRALMLAARSEECVAIADAAMPIMESLNLAEDLIETLINKGTALGNIGRSVEGSVILRGVVVLAEMSDMNRSVVRAINNLSTITSNDDQRDRWFLEEMARLTPRLGDKSWMARLQFMTADEHIGFGELAEAQAAVDLLDTEFAETMWAEFSPLLQLQIGCLINDRSHAPTQELLDVIEPYMATADPQLLSAMHAAKANALVTAGRFDEVAPLVSGMNVDIDTYPEALETAVVASGWIGDTNALAGIAAIIDEKFTIGRVNRGLGLFIAALRAALERREAEASALYLEAVGLWGQVARPRRLALMQAAFASSLGIDTVLGRQAGSAAHQFFAESGAVLYSELFSEVLPDASDVASTAAG